MALEFMITDNQISIYRSRAGRHFFGTENDILPDFGSVEKKNWRPIMSKF